MDPDLLDEDASIRSALAGLGRPALRELQVVLEDAGAREELLRRLIARPASADLAQLVAMADTDETVRLRLLRALRDLGV